MLPVDRVPSRSLSEFWTPLRLQQFAAVATGQQVSTPLLVRHMASSRVLASCQCLRPFLPNGAHNAQAITNWQAKHPQPPASKCWLTRSTLGPWQATLRSLLQQLTARDVSCTLIPLISETSLPTVQRLVTLAALGVDPPEPVGHPARQAGRHSERGRTGSAGPRRLKSSHSCLIKAG